MDMGSGFRRDQDRNNRLGKMLHRMKECHREKLRRIVGKQR
jgi:hypothetical protein